MTPINPATEQELPRPGLHGASEMERRLALSFKTYGEWRTTAFSDRASAVLRLADLLVENKPRLAQSISVEMGKVIREAQAEVDKCAASCRLLVEHFPKWRAKHETVATKGFSTTREPMGVLLGIMPWNFPLWQAIRFAVPAVLCGNTILLKHAPNTWTTAGMLEDLFMKAFSIPLYLDLRIDVENVAPLIADRRLSGVSLTGSRRAGSSVGALAGEHIKKCVLELGGSDAYVVLDDADIALAAKVCATSRLINAGQSCVAAKRFIVTRKNHDTFVAAMAAEMKLKVVGDPLSEKTDVGPLARRDLMEQLRAQVDGSIAKGAKIFYQHDSIPKTGFYYPPTILTHVKPGMPAFDDELFGPAAAVIVAESESDAFRLANQSCYGLGGAVFSSNVERARELARTSMDAGMVFVNDFVKSDALAPFGGVKDSGIGRELGLDGSFEFTTIKTVFT